ncbi:hypothetical protein E2562_016905 [Oryza meyeriana var. granulata]|uniref:Uncharacterized protein n=1 Tax=Oryza meyeriana var. granulata TaxID=110450 RepID=A0A6G1DWU8_9ORYZ|nr:hypothetical protein E2562_016905 [Oryza meyeriana var. granulata]
MAGMKQRLWREEDTGSSSSSLGMAGFDLELVAMDLGFGRWTRLRAASAWKGGGSGQQRHVSN